MSNHLFEQVLGRQAAGTATFIERDGAEPLSFGAFLTLSARLAHALVSAGLSPGDRVVVQAPKSVEMVALYVATIRAGGVFLPLNTAYTRDEVAYFVADAEPAVIVGDPARAGSLSGLATAAGAALLTLGADGAGSLTQGLDTHPAAFAPVPRGPDDLAALLYTSGTTGRSKGAMLTHDNLASNALTLVDLWRLNADDRLIHALPIFHTHGLFVALNTALAVGMRVRFMPSFDLDAIFGAMPDATVMMGVPTFYTRLLSDDRLTRQRAAGMRVFISGSAPLLAETHRAFADRTGHMILERYGMTEASMITSNPYDGDRRAGTVGRPLPGVEVRLTDPETGRPVPERSVGMIEVRGPNVFKGYWRMPEKTAAELRENGFFVTGDLGRLGADGYLSVVGRAKDLIITGGYNVYPKEIEDVLNEVEGVAESAVFGVPHADLGEAIVAAIVSEPGAGPDPAGLTRAVETRLARFKHPRRYELIDALPRNAMGKVQKALLRERFAEAAGAT